MTLDSILYSVRRWIGRTQKDNPSLTHMGLNIGFHGKSLSGTDDGTRQFIQELRDAADKYYHIIQRVNISNKPLNLVVIGRDYNNPPLDALELTNSLVTNRDLVLTEDQPGAYVWTEKEAQLYKTELEKAKSKNMGDEVAQLVAEKEVIDQKLKSQFPKAKKAIYNGVKSNALRRNSEIAGPYHGSTSQESSFIAKQTINFAECGKFNKVYQHCTIPYAVMTEGRKHAVEGKKSLETTYDKTLISEIESADLSYVVLMPRFSNLFSNQDHYLDLLRETAQIKLEDIKDKIEKV